jgi:hypothetical protein
MRRVRRNPRVAHIRARKITADFYSGDPVPDDSTKTASTDTPSDSTDGKKKKSKAEAYGEALGEGLENIGKSYASGAKKETASGPSTIAPPMLPQPMTPRLTTRPNSISAAGECHRDTVNIPFGVNADRKIRQASTV